MRGIQIRPICLSFALILCASTPFFLNELSIIQFICDVDLLVCTGGVQGLRGVRSVVVSPDDKHLYVVSSLDDALLVFSRDEAMGTMTFVQSIFQNDPGIDGLDSGRGVAISPDGNQVYVAALISSSLAVFTRNATTGVLTFLEVEKDGVGGVDGLAGAHDVIVSPDGRHVYVASRSEDALAVFTRDVTTGAVSFLEARFDGVGGINGLDAAEALDISPDGKHIYVVGESDDAIAVFSRETDSNNADFGKTTFEQVLIDGTGGVDGLNGANSVAIDSEGKHVYVGCERGAGGGDWFSVFSRDSMTGHLTFVEGFQEETFGSGSTGIFVGCSGVGPDNSGVVVHPNGSVVFITNPFHGTVAEFMRNPTTGALTLHASICDLNFGLDGIGGAVGITTSRDGRHLYVACPSFETIAALKHTNTIIDDIQGCYLDSLLVNTELLQHPNAPDTFKTTMTVMSDTLLPSAGTIVFIAENDISLLEGFEVPFSATLLASIETCISTFQGATVQAPLSVNQEEIEKLKAVARELRKKHPK